MYLTQHFRNSKALLAEEIKRNTQWYHRVFQERIQECFDPIPYIAHEKENNNYEGIYCRIWTIRINMMLRRKASRQNPKKNGFASCIGHLKI